MATEGVGIIVAIDPGVKVAGWAIFKKKRLWRCGIARGKQWADTVDALPRLTSEVTVVEHPVAYPRSSVNPNGLIKLGIMAGAAAKAFDAIEIMMPTPREWKGQTPKAIHNKRVLAKLTLKELKIHNKADVPKSLVHNMTDAVGLGLWALNRG